MADISKIKVNDATYNVKDSTARATAASKQDALTFDSAPVSGSTNPVTSGGVYSSQQTQDSAITFATNAGVKNLLNLTGASDSTVTVNSDGTMTADGTNSANVSITLGTVTLKAGRYILSSGVNLPQGVYLSVRVGAGETKYDCTHDVESVEFTVPSDMTMDRVWIFISKNTTIDNMTIRPMIRHAEIADDTFVPYAPTNRELYEMILTIAQQNGISLNSVASTTSLTKSDISDLSSDTFSFSSDGSEQTGDFDFFDEDS